MISNGVKDTEIENDMKKYITVSSEAAMKKYKLFKDSLSM